MLLPWGTRNWAENAFTHVGELWKLHVADGTCNMGSFERCEVFPSTYVTDDTFTGELTTELGPPDLEDFAVWLFAD